MTGAASVSRTIYLNPGELVIAEDSLLVTTVLGSCVSVILFCPRPRIGAICHAVMPSGRGNQPSRFVDQSVGYMLNCFRQKKILPGAIVAKLFGGADMFSHSDPGDKEKSVGAQNIRMALASLQRAGVVPAAVDVGGRQGRKLIFNTCSGEVFLKRI